MSVYDGDPRKKCPTCSFWPTYGHDRTTLTIYPDRRPCFLHLRTTKGRGVLVCDESVLCWQLSSSEPTLAMLESRFEPEQVWMLVGWLQRAGVDVIGRDEEALATWKAYWGNSAC